MGFREKILCLIPFILLVVGREQGRVQNGGLYGTWVENCSILATIPQVLATGVVIEWNHLNPEQGVYNWTLVKEKFAGEGSCGTQISVFQVNANKHPSWFASVIPTAPSWDDPEDSDPMYLQYWHPRFIQERSASAKAVAAFLRSLDGYIVSAVRQNWNAIGTEHFSVPKEYWNASSWHAPPGVENGADFNASATIEQYQEAVFATFVEEYKGMKEEAPLYARNDLVFNENIIGKYGEFWKNGTFSWMHTSSELEPRSASVAERYEVFLDYCRTGMTTCYAEPWADAWGLHGGAVDSRWAAPTAWIWNRVLSDLNNGVSKLAMYGSDLSVIATSAYLGHPVPPEYQAAFNASALLVDRYAGYAASPSSSPGAFVSFRRSILPLGGYNVRVQDYSHLANLTNRDQIPSLDARVNGTQVPLLPNNITRPGMQALGPPTSPFGAWARLITTSTPPLKISINSTLISRTSSTTSKLCLTFLDTTTWPPSPNPQPSSSASILLKVGPSTRTPFPIPVQHSNQWVTKSFLLQPPLKPISNSTTLTIQLSESTPTSTKVVLSFVEFLVDPNQVCAADWVNRE